jgi:anti-sigma regulatory factor (Ser/Thr protein kinase)
MTQVLATGREQRHAKGAADRCWQLPFAPQAARQARELTRQVLAGWGLAALADDVTLMISELVANAVTHGAPPVTLRLALERGSLTCEVTDSGRRMPTPCVPGLDSQGGRGLAIVAALASESGVRSYATGKTAWFTITVTASARGAA